MLNCIESLGKYQKESMEATDNSTSGTDQLEERSKSMVEVSSHELDEQ